MKAYSHVYTLAFTIVSHEKDGSDVTPAMAVCAVLTRTADLLANNEINEALGGPDDTCEVAL